MDPRFAALVGRGTPPPIGSFHVFTAPYGVFCPGDLARVIQGNGNYTTNARLVAFDNYVTREHVACHKNCGMGLKEFLEVTKPMAERAAKLLLSVHGWGIEGKEAGKEARNAGDHGEADSQV